MPPRKVTGILLTLMMALPALAANFARSDGDRPFLRPAPSDADTKPPELLSVAVTQAPAPLNAEDKRTFPEGTVKRTTTLSGSGFPQISHSEYTLAEGMGTNMVMSDGRRLVTLPDGRRFAANGLTCYNPIPGFRLTPGGLSPWGFLELILKADKASRGIGLLQDSACVSTITHTGTNWASADMVFKRILGNGTNITLLLSFKRIVGDPFLYLSVYAPEEQTQGMSRSLHLAGYPMGGGVALYGGGGCTHYPGCSSFFTFQRWMWVNGRDWNLHDSKEKHAAEPDLAQPPLFFWYNRDANEMSGIITLFLPEELESFDASGTYSVEINLRPKRPVIRLALREWADWRGWEPVRAEVLASSGACVQRLRALSFAWPSPELIDGATRRMTLDAMAAATAAPVADDLSALKKRLEQAVASYDQVLSEARKTPARTDLEICRQQQTLLLAKGAVDDALAGLRAALAKTGSQAVKNGGAK